MSEILIPGQLPKTADVRIGYVYQPGRATALFIQAGEVIDRIDMPDAELAQINSWREGCGIRPLNDIKAYAGEYACGRHFRIEQ